MEPLIRVLRRFLPPAAKRRLKAILGLPPTRLHPDWRILRSIGPIHARHVVLDIGSYHGWFFQCWKDWCPAAEIHAFEPAVEAHRRAVELYGSDPLVKLNCVAVGDAPGSGELHVMEKSTSANSFLPNAAATWHEIKFETGTVTKRPVAVTTVDEYCREHGITAVYLMKIDVNGYEMAVLKGAERALPVIDHVFVESGIRPLYRGAARFTAVCDYLGERGFHLMAMRAWHRGNRVLVEADLLFRRNSLMPGVDERIERVYEEIGDEIRAGRG